MNYDKIPVLFDEIDCNQILMQCKKDRWKLDDEIYGTTGGNRLFLQNRREYILKKIKKTEQRVDDFLNNFSLSKTQ